jgi:geranylgeranyl pyrophosphate synthase
LERAAAPPPVTVVEREAGAWLPARMAAVEGRLVELTTSFGGVLSADAAATLAAGGKRLRPLLVLLCAGPAGGPEAIRGATAVELIHMATLVHDDVLDAAPLRRGEPTVVARSGRERAVATGDLLFSRAFAELGEAGGDRQVELLSAASVSLALGELAQRRDAYDTRLSRESYLERCGLKTARLFECACMIGRHRRDDDGDDPSASRLAAFGREIGLAFQLLDDVLDIAGPPRRTGKARGTDLLDGTVTLPLILAREQDVGLAELDLHGLDRAGALRACERIERTGALESVRELAGARIAAARRELASAPLSAEERRLLGLVADGVVERYS